MQMGTQRVHGYSVRNEDGVAGDSIEAGVDARGVERSRAAEEQIVSRDESCPERGRNHDRALAGGEVHDHDLRVVAVDAGSCGDENRLAVGREVADGPGLQPPDPLRAATLGADTRRRRVSLREVHDVVGRPASNARSERLTERSYRPALYSDPLDAIKGEETELLTVGREEAVGGAFGSGQRPHLTCLQLDKGEGSALARSRDVGQVRSVWRE